MLPRELKQYIFNNNKIEFILKQIGCHHINTSNSKYISCGNVDGDNQSCINVFRNEYLGVQNYTRTRQLKQLSNGKQPDIITLVQYNLSVRNSNNDFKTTIHFLHDILGLKLTSKPNIKYEKKVDPLAIFTKYAAPSYDSYIEELKEIEEDDNCIPYIHIEWFREGIIKRTIDKFGLGYSPKYMRNVIPLRHWLDGRLLGYNKRTIIKDYDELGIRKYHITPSYKKQRNLFGLFENYEAIKKKKYVTVFEAEKSVLKRDSLLDSTGVAISGSVMSMEQAKILIGLNVDIVIALDKDISLQDIRAMCEMFYNIRNVYYMYDKYSLLAEKDSPADARDQIYQFLFKYRVKYDENEHKKYLDELDKD